MQRSVPLLPPPRDLGIPIYWSGLGEEVRRSIRYRWEGSKRGPNKHILWQYTLSGEGFIRIGAGEPRRLRPGNGFLTQFPGDHCYYWRKGSPPWRFLWMMWGGPAIEAVANTLIRTPVRLINLDPTDYAITTTAAMIETVRSGHGGADPWESSAEAFRLLLILCRPVKSSETAARQNPSPALGRVERLLRATPRASIGKEGVAARIGLSRFQLYRAMKREVGVSPKEWLTRRRIDRACTLLKTTDRGIADIAMTVGIPDTNYFARFFRRRTGLAPRDWRRMYGKL